MVATGIETDGLDEWISRLDDIAATLSQEIADALQAAGDAFINDAQASAPVDTGFLRDNIQVVSSSDTELVIESQADYSGFVEYGTSRMSAQPFFEPAIESARNELEQRLSDIQI
jgi:HK97 gp10 family phage protein